MARLKDLKTRLNQSMPESDDELQSAEKSNQVHFYPVNKSQVNLSGWVTPEGVWSDLRGWGQNRGGGVKERFLRVI